MCADTKKDGTGEGIAELVAEIRTDTGTRSCRRLRQKGLVPANLYGHKMANVSLTVPEREFSQQYRAGRRILNLRFGNDHATGMVKEVQYDALGDHVIHVDFARISLTERIHLLVPIETVGVAKGAAGGGIFELTRKQLDLEGPATEIPQRIEIVVSELMVGDSIRVKDIKLPPTCTILHATPEDVIAAIHVPKKVEEAPVEAAAAEATAEPEVIGKPKEEEAAAEPGKKEAKEAKEGKEEKKKKKEKE